MSAIPCAPQSQVRTDAPTRRSRPAGRAGGRLFGPPLLRSAAHTLSEVTGMSMLVMPRCDNASMTALTYAAGDPTVADSPTPFAPLGWGGDGGAVSAGSHTRGVPAV